MMPSSPLSYYFREAAGFFLLVVLLTIAAGAEPVQLSPEQQESLQLLTLDAAREGDMETVSAYLESGFSPNIASERGDTLLILATYYGHAMVVEALLANEETEVNLINKMGFTALTGAAFRGRVAILKTLLKHGATVDSVNSKGQTALMFAAMFGKKAAVAELIAHGADTTRLTPDGKTAADLALEQGRLKMGDLIAAAVAEREQEQLSAREEQ